ncbi:Uncharacterised protein [Mycobacterium tuberculosis]|uniref:Uncharacterized protein n=2 Tax=Mycobacterium tuberculosis TaxID=1773 RepID=A0A0T9E0D3_MYCTX|nr:Uncharacterised protein [Mycobacterium tuberculosis]CFE62760.1 Uncharacterised protein [Mycobacterium tuberculosis]CKP52532.1 Uncharacterised protein [Mycobacterium tuberculosis]CKR26389.1 Uncharacterised protein [Mycobacterium tuberculosis]CKS75862.1 Uncharacterised protein [Mycobacterium tuberculosis]
MISLACSSCEYFRVRSAAVIRSDCSSRVMNVPVPAKPSRICTPSSVSPRPKCLRDTKSAARTMKSTTSTGVYTIPSASACFLKPMRKNFSYSSAITCCLPSALVTSPARRRTDS